MHETLDIPRDPNRKPWFQADSLRKLMVALFVKKGMFPVEAEVVADRLVEADLRGPTLTGAAPPRRVPPSDRPRRHRPPRTGSGGGERETGATEVIDGGRAVGHLGATRAMGVAVGKAASPDGDRRRQKRLAAVPQPCTSRWPPNGDDRILHHQYGLGHRCGVREPHTGRRNPAMAWGIPVRSGAPVILDVACAVSSWGGAGQSVIVRAIHPCRLGVRQQPGTGPRTPPTAKTLLPAAGARGYGLAFVSGILTGPLVGNEIPPAQNRKGSKGKAPNTFSTASTSPNSPNLNNSTR